jgi:hypothetical protein
MMIVIDNLGPNDRLSIVLVGSDAHRLMELTYMSDRGQAEDQRAGRRTRY